jgi:hypothetical protein
MPSEKHEAPQYLVMTNFELSETPGFMDRYMAALFLPHTQAEYFPTVMKRLEGVGKRIL